MTLRLRLPFSFVTLAAALSGCATTAPSWETVAARAPAPVVTAGGETVAVATANADAADDPAIWRDPTDPSRSLIIGTDKKAGINVYGLDGAQRDFVAAGHVNNVDLIATPGGVLVAASDRNDLANAKIALFLLDTTTAKLRAIGSVAGGAGEAYGICLASAAGGIDAFIVLKDGTINHVAIDLASGAPTGRIVRTMKLATQSEGCVVDPRTQRLYVAEEDIGIWRFDARRDGATAAIPMAKVDGRTLVADVEGLALAGDWLVASSQGDNAYTIYALADDRYVGRFRIGAGTFGAVSETDGIEVVLGDFGPKYPGGLLVAQDGDNAPRAQNFKLVPWEAVKAAVAAR